jgi:hypothetical protein
MPLQISLHVFTPSGPRVRTKADKLPVRCMPPTPSLFLWWRKGSSFSQIWQKLPSHPSLRHHLTKTLDPEGLWVQASLGYIVRHCLKKAFIPRISSFSIIYLVFISEWEISHFRARSVAQVVEYLSGKCKALCSNSSTTEGRQGGREGSYFNNASKCGILFGCFLRQVFTV